MASHAITLGEVSGGNTLDLVTLEEGRKEYRNGMRRGRIQLRLGS